MMYSVYLRERLRTRTTLKVVPTVGAASFEESIFVPSCGVVFDVLSNSIQITIISNDMIVEGSLPYVNPRCPTVFVDPSCGERLESSNDLRKSMTDIVGVIMDCNDAMEMVRHDDG